MTLPDGPRAEHSLGAFPTLGFYSLTEELKRETANALAQFEHVAIHQAWDNCWKAWIDCAACVGAEIVTVHAGRPREAQRASEFFAERAAQLRRMGDYARENGMRIGVENEGGTCEDYVGLIDSVDHPCVGATLDLGHCAYFRSVLALSDPAERVVSLNETISTMIMSLNAKLYSVHAHDVRQSDWRDHRCAGSGVIDFPALFKSLRQVEYAGLFEIELEEPDRERAAAKTGHYLTLCRTTLANAPGADWDVASL